ncbi:unnamed protein product, partial [marine sediment metagenome]
MDLYAKCETEDGYLRDGCLYRENIDTYDTNSVLIKYANDCQVTYSLIASAPYEGQRIVLNGSKGRIEVRNYHTQPWQPGHPVEIRLSRNFKDSILMYPGSKEWGTIAGHEKAGDEAFKGHYNADQSIKKQIFVPGTADVLSFRAGSRAGVMSAIIGIAAYTSIEKRKT